MMQVESDQGAGGSGIGIAVQHNGGFVFRSEVTEQALGDQLVHVDVGLMQPPSPNLGDRFADLVDLLFKMGCRSLFR